MGNGSDYLTSGGFIAEHWQTVDTIAGVKVLKHESESRSDLPQYSNTSNAYFKANANGEIIQLRIYSSRRASIDIDLMPNAEHRDKGSNEILPRGVAHVHEWRENKNSKWVRGKTARYLSHDEIVKWGEIIRLANPHVKFKL